MLPPDIGWYELLTLRADELVERGLEREHVVPLRRAYCGSELPYSDHWAQSVGSWGRVRSAEEVAAVTGRTREEVRQKAKSCDLKFATRCRQRTQAELAVLCYTDRDRPPDVVRRHLGILPVERLLYCAAAQVVLDETAMSIDELLDMSLPSYEALWAELGLVIAPPRPTRVDYSDTVALEALVAQIEASMERS